MQIEAIRIEDLKLDEENARLHGIRNMGAIVASLERFGQQKPIVINAENVVKAGNGTLEAAKELEWETVDCVRSELDGPELAAYAIADNRTSELAEWDMDILVEQLKTLDEMDTELLYASGFNDGELSALLVDDGDDDGNDVNDPAEEWKGMPEFQQAKIGFRTMIVHFEDESAFKKFMKLMKQTVTDKTKFIWYPEAKRAETADQRVASES